jgi:signal transduction histidine kinase
MIKEVDFLLKNINCITFAARMTNNHTRLLCLLCGVFIWNIALAQHDITLHPGFDWTKITPNVLRDSAALLPRDSVLAGKYDHQFYSAGSPFLSYGKNPIHWWLQYTVNNPGDQVQDMVMRINRKNFDSVNLYVREPDGQIRYYGAVGAAWHADPRYRLTDGFHYALKLPPGISQVYAQVSNKASAMHLVLSLRTPENFASQIRWKGLLFGVFTGVMALSLCFTFLLYYTTRDKIYLLYFAYVVNILLREAYNFSMDFGFFPAFQRYATSVFIAITFGLFFRKFIRLDVLNPMLDRIVKGYMVFVSVAILLILTVALTGHEEWLKPINMVGTTTNLIFTFVAIYISLRYYRTSVRAKILTMAYLPLGVAFVAILLRNIGIVPNYPVIQNAVLWGFLSEVLIFTIGFAYYHQSVETEKKILTYQLAIEDQKQELAVQRLKDRIARDLHDDVAASMSGIRILSEVAESQVKEKAPESGALLAQITQNAQQTLDSISDLIWAVKPSHDYLNDLADRIRHQAGQVLQAKGIDYEIIIPRDLPLLALDAEKRRNAFLIFKEALNNVVKYSQCTKVKILLSYDQSVMQLIVQDDGRGFDLNTVEQGNGLVNMYRRAVDMGGEISIKSAPGAGTTVEMSLRVASSETA